MEKKNYWQRRISILSESIDVIHDVIDLERKRN
jgi:hypothetical protein